MLWSWSQNSVDDRNIPRGLYLLGGSLTLHENLPVVYYKAEFVLVVSHRYSTFILNAKTVMAHRHLFSNH